MRHLTLRFLSIVLIGFLNVTATSTLTLGADDISPPLPSAPSPAQLKADKKVVESEAGTDLTSQDKTDKRKDLRLTWQKGEVPPLCLEKLVMGETRLQRIAVADCEKEAGLIVGKTYRKDGYLQTDYRYKDFMADDPNLTAMYRVSGFLPQGVAVEISSFTGGSGRFTTIAVVKVEGPNLSLVKAYDGGDRCNGGVAVADVRGNDLFYGIYLTPGDFPLVATGSDQGLTPYEDLESSAASCFAIAHHKNGKLDNIELLPEAVKNTDPEWTARYTLQRCFNLKFKEQSAKGTTLTPEEFKGFVKYIMANCKKA